MSENHRPWGDFLTHTVDRHTNKHNNTMYASKQVKMLIN